MRLISVEMPAEHTLVLGGDWHIGNRACSYDTIQAMLDRVKKDKKTFFCHMGDVAEMTPIDHKHFSIDQVVPPPGCDKPLVTASEQYGYFEDIFERVSNQTVTVLQGNHDMRLNSSAGNLLQASCDRLGVVYGTYMSKVAVYVGKKFRILEPSDVPDSLPDYQMLLWHGWGSVGSRSPDPIRREATRRIGVSSKLAPLADDCDIMAMGHIHQLDVFEHPIPTMLVNDSEKLSAIRMHYPPTTVNLNGTKHRLVSPWSRTYAVTGTALKGYDYDPSAPYSTYSEKSGYVPADLGWVEIDYKKGKLSGHPVVRTRA